MEHTRYSCQVNLNNKSELLQIYDCNEVYASLWYSGICDAIEAMGGIITDMVTEKVSKEQICQEYKEEEGI